LLPGGGNTMNFGPFLLIAILLLVAWAGGFLMFHIAGALIHVLLVFAALSFIFHFITGRRTA
jgi:Flp pilus assembly protein TadB